MKTIRFGVVGLGHRGRNLAVIASTFDCAQFVAACDLKEANFTEQQWLLNASLKSMFPETKFYSDYDKMLEEADLDLVIVETGADIHADFCIKALEKNINVLTDIPVVANLDEADRLWKAAQKSTAMISVGANPNYQKFTILLKEFYEKGLLGKPYYMEAEYIHWGFKNTARSKHLHENGDWRKLLVPVRYCTHSLGPLLTVLEEDLKYVSCVGTGKTTPESTKDDMMAAQFQTKGGAIVRFLRNARCRAKIGHHNYRVFGTEGYMERIDRIWDPDNEMDKAEPWMHPVIRYNSTKELNTDLKQISGEYMPPKYANNPKAVGHGGLDYAMLDSVFDAILNGKEAPISLRDGLRMTLPGIYAQQSALKNGEIVEMFYPWDKEWKTTF